MTDVPFGDRPLPQWYDDIKFGIFIHWGAWTVPCFAPVDHDMGDMMRSGDWKGVFRNSPYSEWYLNSLALEGSPVQRHHLEYYGDRTYASFMDEFHERSRGVDTARWVDLFEMAGARYVVPVTKHHDGFLLWHSDIPNPHRANWMSEADHIDRLATAVRARGMRFGLYYSGGLDWTFREPPIRDLRSLIDNIPSTDEYGEYATAHYHELIERFRPDVLWNDIGWPSNLDPNDLLAHYYAQVPHGVVNDRFNMLATKTGRLHADFFTPEYSTTASAKKWEVCRGIGRSFGYNRMENDSTFPSVDETIWMLADIVSRGGNLLLNVGPTADGVIPLRQAMHLTTLGWWLRVNGEAIFGTRPGGTLTAADGRPVGVTHTATMTYLLAKGAPSAELRVSAPQPSSQREVRMLGSSRVLPSAWRDGELRIQLPDHLPPSPVTVFSISA